MATVSGHEQACRDGTVVALLGTNTHSDATGRRGWACQPCGWHATGSRRYPLATRATCCHACATRLLPARPPAAEAAKKLPPPCRAGPGGAAAGQGPGAAAGQASGAAGAAWEAGAVAGFWELVVGIASALVEAAAGEAAAKA